MTSDSRLQSTASFGARDLYGALQKAPVTLDNERPNYIRGPVDSEAAPADVGTDIYRCIVDLYPICRSITGEGLRETLRRLQQLIPLTIHEVPTGTQVFDWTVPKEWNIRDAYVKNTRGERVIDFQDSNLHVVHYSVPVQSRMPLSALMDHLFTLPEHPDWVPYRCSYYDDTWGFCLSHRQLLELEDGEYEICIDSTLAPGSLSYGECYLKGQTDEEVLISCHVCHPSLANDNLSAVALAAYLARYLEVLPRRYSYRFLFIPGTIGSITWLALNEAHLSRIKHGLVLSTIGDAGPITYKKSRRRDSEIDRVVEQVLREAGHPHQILEFQPYGDERQFCSPGIDLAMGCLSRSAHGGYAEHHTTADDLHMVHDWALRDSFEQCVNVLNVLESNRSLVSLNPKCEPHLGRRGLYHKVPGGSQQPDSRVMLWLLSLSDGQHSLLDIAQRSGYPFRLVKEAGDVLEAAGLLRPLESPTVTGRRSAG